MRDSEDRLDFRLRGATLQLNGVPTAEDRTACAAALFALMRGGSSCLTVDLRGVSLPHGTLLNELTRTALDACHQGRDLVVRAGAGMARLLHLMGIDKFCRVVVA